MKKILLLAVLLGIISQVSYTKTDPDIERLVKIAKKKQAEQEKEAKKQQLTDSLLEEGEDIYEKGNDSVRFRSTYDVLYKFKGSAV